MGSDCCCFYNTLISNAKTAQMYLEKAQAAFEWAVVAAPNDVRPYLAKWEILVALGNYDDAVAAA